MTTATDFTTSPFRSKDKAERRAGCERMVELLEAEGAKLDKLAKILAKRAAKLSETAETKAEGRQARSVAAKQALHLKTRRRAVTNRLKSWAQYAKRDYPYVPGAVEIPGVLPHRDN